MSKTISKATAGALIGLLMLTGCGASKPDKAEVRKGLVTMLSSNGAIKDADVAGEIADCMIEELYDEMSAKTLNAWADGKDLTDPDDAAKVTATSQKCSTEALTN